MPQRLVDVRAVQAIISRPASMRAHEESPVPTLGAQAAFRVADEAAAKPPSEHSGLNGNLSIGFIGFSR
jgi:hypothetical protein